MGNPGLPPGGMMKKYIALVTIVLVTLLLPLGCKRGGPVSSKLTSITIEGSPTTLTLGSTAKFVATATYVNGTTKDVTSQVFWASARTGIITMPSPGLFTGKAAGSTVIWATMDNLPGPPVLSNSVTLAVFSSALVDIIVRPGFPSIAVGSQQQFTATATYSDGSEVDVTSEATWACTDDIAHQSSPSKVATISSAGLATVVVPGKAYITASMSGETSLFSTLNVTPFTGATPVNDIKYPFTGSANGLGTLTANGITDSSVKLGIDVIAMDFTPNSVTKNSTVISWYVSSSKLSVSSGGQFDIPLDGTAASFKGTFTGEPLLSPGSGTCNYVNHWRLER